MAISKDGVGDGAGGFYNPEVLPYPVRPDYQEFVNRTNGILSIQIQDAIHNLLTLTPALHGENLLLAGEDVVWLPRFTSGPLCSSYDDHSGQCIQSKCKECFNTNYQGGFDEPVFLKMSFIPGRSDVMIEQAGLTVSQKPTAWTITTNPNIEERDMIVTYRNERYMVHASEHIDKQGRTMYQFLTLSRIDKTDTFYYVPTPGLGGEKFDEFRASITITEPKNDPNVNMPGANFAATIFIRNFHFYGGNGTEDIFGWDESDS